LLHRDGIEHHQECRKIRWWHQNLPRVPRAKRFSPTAIMLSTRLCRVRGDKLLPTAASSVISLCITLLAAGCGQHSQKLVGRAEATGVVPENSIREDSPGEAESAHHLVRCLRSSNCSERSSPTCSGRRGGLKSRTSFSAISSILP